MIKTFYICKLLYHLGKISRELNQVIDKYNCLVDDYNKSREQVRQLQMGLDYCSNVILASIQLVPPELQEKLRNDMDFIDIAIRERE